MGQKWLLLAEVCGEIPQLHFRVLAFTTQYLYCLNKHNEKQTILHTLSDGQQNLRTPITTPIQMGLLMVDERDITF